MDFKFAHVGLRLCHRIDSIINSPLTSKGVVEMKRATSSMNDLLSAIDSADFDNEDLKTSYFNIQTEYENYNDENGHYK